MNRKKIIILSVVGAIILGLGILFWGSYGFTAKSRFTNCLKNCYDLMLLESSKQYCPDKCTEIHKFEPTAAELAEIISKIENIETKTETNASPTKNTNTVKNVNTVKNTNSVVTNISAATNSSSNTNINLTDYQNRSYYCNWVWYQEIIDKDTQELIFECPGSRPWCFYADYTFENVGCCSDAEHTDCVTLPNLL